MPHSPELLASGREGDRSARPPSLRVLLTEGSGLTSRQVATRLGALGHEVEVLSSTDLCLARFCRHVRRLHRVPAFGAEPLAWLEAALGIARARRVDVLFPTQEQVAVISAFRDAIGVATLVPPFAALRRVQDKVSAYGTLRRLGVAQPEAWVVRSRREVSRVRVFPSFVKRPIGTASSGVCRVRTRAELETAAAALGLEPPGLLVQAEAQGPLAMVQAVADRGRMVAFHASLRVREGVSGGAALKESLALPALEDAVSRLCRALGWHGPLSLDAVLAREGPLVIDVNPRLVEPMNAWFAGVDLVRASMALAQGQSPPAEPPGHAGVRSHQLLLAILEAAKEEGRCGVAREVTQAMLRRGCYAGSEEELTPLAGDPLAIGPVVLTALATAVRPRSWRWFDAGAVGAYALTPSGWRTILRASESDFRDRLRRRVRSKSQVGRICRST